MQNGCYTKPVQPFTLHTVVNTELDKEIDTVLEKALDEALDNQIADLQAQLSALEKKKQSEPNVRNTLQNSKNSKVKKERRLYEKQ